MDARRVGGELKEDLHHYRYPVLVLCLGIGLSILAFFLVLRADMYQLEKDFVTYGENQYSRVIHRINTYKFSSEITHTGLQTLNELSGERFERLVSPLMLRGKFWAYLRVSPDMKIMHEVKRTHSRFDWSYITQKNSPFLRAVKRASTRKDLVVSDVFFAAKEASTQNNLAFVFPLFKEKKLDSYIVGILDIKDFFSFYSSWSNNRDNFDVYVYDISGNDIHPLYVNISENRISKLLGDNNQYESVSRLVPFRFEKQLKIPGQRWKILIVPTSQYLSRAVTLNTWMTLLGGVLLTGVLSILIFVLVTRNLKITEIVDQRTRELKQSNDELEQFAYVASHDLKSPLRAINQLAIWIGDDLGKNLKGEAKENLLTLRKRAKRMEKLLNDLLEYSRYTSQLINVKNSRQDGEAIINSLQLLIEIPEEITLNVSPAFLKLKVQKMPFQQVLINLVENAIKHRDDVTSQIDIGVESLDSLYWVFTVRDDGPGIPREYHEKVFEMFQTLKPRDEVEGSGMGLAFVKKIINSLGCKIRIDPTNSRGTSIIFSWPKHFK